MMKSNDVPIFLSRQWAKAFAHHILTNSEDYFEVKTSQDAAMLPFYHCSSGTIHSLSNYYSPYYQAFESQNEASIDLTQLLTDKNFTKLSILPMTQEVLGKLKAQLKDTHYYLEAYYHTQNWRHTCISDYDNFKAKCSPNLIKSTERYRRKIEKNTSFKIEFLGNQFSPNIFNDYLRVFEKSWKKTEPSLAFLREVYSDAQTLGQLRIGFIYFQGTAVSVQLWFVANKVGYIYKLAYDEAFANHRVGNVLLLEMARHLIEQEGIQSIDFLTGEDGYKAKWMTECRDLYGVNIYNKKTIAGLCGYIASKSRQAIKQFLRIG